MERTMKKLLFARSLHWYDSVLVTICAILAYACIRLWIPPAEAFNQTTELSYGYIGRTAQGTRYVIDQGHARLIAFDANDQEIFEIVDPSDNEESILYIDDVFVDDDTVYLTASEWDGMLLSRELILAYDMSGKYQKTITELVYDLTDNTTNKHRIYGLHREGEKLVWAECYSNVIRVHYHSLDEGSSDNLWTPAYPDSLDAVADIVFDEDGSLIVLNKNGRIRRYLRDGKSRLLYRTTWAGEEDHVPFRLALSNGSVYYTDIAQGTVQRVVTRKRMSETVYEGTDSQTVTFSEDGKEMLLAEADGLLVVSDTGMTRQNVLKLTSKLVLFHLLFFANLVCLVITALLTIMRLASIALGRSIQELTTGPIVAVTVAFIVCAIVSYILIGSFRELYLGKIHEQLQMTSSQVSLRITEEDLDGVSRADDFGSDAYNKLITVMDEAMPLEVDFFHTTYCNILRMDADGQGGHAIAYRDQSIGTYFPLDEVETEELFRVYETKESVWNDELLDVTGSYVLVKSPIFGERGNVIGVVAVGADTSVVNELITDMQKEVLLSIVLVLLLFWIIATEAISYASQSVAQTAQGSAVQTIQPSMLRILIFALFAAFNLVSSFLPVYVLHQSESITGPLHDLAATLPLTINIFAMGVMSLFCAPAMRRFGVRRVFVGSMACSLVGNVLLFIAAGYPFIVAGLLLDGIGVGMITNAIYVALTYLPDENAREGAFSTYNGASMSGINFGMILGSILAVSLKQRAVFLVVVIAWAGLIFFALNVSKHFEQLIGVTVGEDEAERAPISLASFIGSRPIWSFILLIQNPYIVFNSFAYYFVPLFCDTAGLRETIASVLLMAYSQTAVMLGDTLTEHMEQRHGGRAVYLALVLNVIAVALYISTQTIWGLVAALLLLGSSAAFAKPCQQSLYLRQDASKRLGEDQAMGIYNFSENIGESLGPIVFGKLMSGPIAGVWAFLGSIGCAIGAHYALNRKEMRRG